MATIPLSAMLGKRIRVTQLDECGAVVDGARFITTRGYITVSLTSEVEDGAEILVRRADGSLCVNERQNPSFKYFNLEIEFCEVNPSLLAIMSNAVEYENYDGDIAGFTIAEGEITQRFAFEHWSGTTGGACGAEGELSGYMVLPHVAGGVLGDIEFNGEDSVTFTVTGATTRGGNSWGVGPYDVLYDTTDPENPVAAPLPEALDPYDHFLMMLTTLAPPEADDEPQTLSLP